MKKNLEKITFVLSTLVFIASLYYLIININQTPIKILSFAALEYLFFYVYTIYDHIKNMKN